jgi:hypothetical protein
MTFLLLCQLLTADSLTLDWHPIFNATAEQAKKILDLEKSGQLNHLPGNWQDNQRPHPMHPDDGNLMRIEEEANWS